MRFYESEKMDKIKKDEVIKEDEAVIIEDENIKEADDIIEPIQPIAVEDDKTFKDEVIKRNELGDEAQEILDPPVEEVEEIKSDNTIYFLIAGIIGLGIGAYFIIDGLKDGELKKEDTQPAQNQAEKPLKGQNNIFESQGADNG